MPPVRIHHINAATMCPISARLVNGKGGWLAPARMVCHCLLVETADGLILVDTGIGSADVADPAGRLGKLFLRVARPVCDPEEIALEQVKRLGFRPEEVRHLVPTHLDLDHAGGFGDFPWASVHVFAAEHEAAMNPRTANERRRYRAVHWAHGPTWVLRPADGEDWRGFRGVQAIEGNPDVLLIPLEGHTRGHCGVAVRTGSGWLVHAGDAYFHHDEMSTDAPRCPPGLRLFQRIVAVDNPRRLANQARLRELVGGNADVRVHCAHDPDELAELTG